MGDAVRFVEVAPRDGFQNWPEPVATEIKERLVRDLLEAGVGTVEQIVPPHIEDNAKPIPAQVWVRVNGALAAAETVFGSAQLRVGGQGRVVYRIGKSGRVYVDSVEPLAEPAYKPSAK